MPTLKYKNTLKWAYYGLECDSIVDSYKTKDSLQLVKQIQYKENIDFQKEIIEKQIKKNNRLKKVASFLGGTTLVSIALIFLL